MGETFKPTRAELRAGIKRREREPHCWHTPEEGASCMLPDGHEGPHDYIPDARILIGSRDGKTFTVKVTP